ncbi:MAG: hypothetical protein Q9220_002101 [cf. Caloplaca sp. 1 TL-2023]
MPGSKPLSVLTKGATGTLEARKGKAITMKKGQSLKITNTHGKQVIDFFAFGLDVEMQPLPPTTLDFLSMQHTRSGNFRICFQKGSKLFSNHRKPMFTIVEDSSPGTHDAFFPACDPARYRQLGVEGHHASCAENLHIALAESGYPFPEGLVPAPFNLWMNVPLSEGGAMAIEAPVSREGDYVVLQAEENCLVVCSNCPQDLAPTNGYAQKPTDCHYEIVFHPSINPQQAVSKKQSLLDASAEMAAACIFCKIIKGDIPSFKLFENDRLLAFLDIQPLSLGHAPVAKKIAKALNVENYNILQNNGRMAHQEVDHVHFHMIPKPNQAEGLGISWPAQETDMDKLKAFYNDIKAKM